jgi:hypothetical protein
MGLYPKHVEEFLVLSGIPRGPKSDVFFVDPVNGSDSNPGRSFEAPLKTVAAAYAKCVGDQHDTVVMLSGDTADNPAAAINWSKDYTHLVGLSSDLPGVGQRARVVGTAALDLTQLITFAGNGCIARNLQFFNGGDADADAGAAIVSGHRNAFKNVFFAGMGHATPGARAGSYSLKVTGQENLFEDCAVGLDTILRAAANAELWLSTGSARNIFRRSRFLSYSETAAKVAVKIDDMDRWVEFEDCTFQNFSVNWATALSNVFGISAAATHQIILKGKNIAVGFTGWADVAAHVYSAEPAPNAGFGLGLNPTT